jgi:hypothetical protein
MLSCIGESHNICYNNLQFFIKNPANITYENINMFVELLVENTGCIAGFNKKKTEIKQFLISVSSSISIKPYYNCILSSHFTDVELLTFIKNQKSLDDDYITKLISCNYTTKYGNQMYFLIVCGTLNKYKTLEYVFGFIDIDNFIIFTKQLKDNNIITIEKLLLNYIIINMELIKTNKQRCFLIENLVNNARILDLLIKENINTLNSEEKITILNEIVKTVNINPLLILTIMESKDVMPNMNTIKNFLSKVNSSICRLNGTAKNIAEIIDIFIIYGFKITKEVIIMLLKKGCYINNIDRHYGEIDNSILEVCSEMNYFPYNITCIPSIKIMLLECAKQHNLEQIRQLHKKGGTFDIECLKNACHFKYNNEVIKYIITEGGVKPNKECLIIFQETYNVNGLECLMENFSDVKKIANFKNNCIELSEDVSINIEPSNIKIEMDKEYILKNKIKKLFNYKGKNIKYDKLYELMLRYLIEQKLIIGNYFVINEELFNILKINQCTIVNIDEIDNILTYFIEDI